MLRSCLYRRALVFRYLLAPVLPSLFKADHELVTRVGLLTKPEALDDEIDVYWHHPSNRSFPRRVMCIRVSTRRVRRLFGLLMPRAAPVAQNDPPGATADDGEWSTPPWRVPPRQ
jgi:hypothetical protein